MVHQVGLKELSNLKSRILFVPSIVFEAICNCRCGITIIHSSQQRILVPIIKRSKIMHLMSQKRIL